jgi:hypothetical protein
MAELRQYAPVRLKDGGSSRKKDEKKPEPTRTHAPNVYWMEVRREVGS